MRNVCCEVCHEEPRRRRDNGVGETARASSVLGLHGLKRPVRAKIFAPDELIEKLASADANFAYETDFFKVFYLEKDGSGYANFVREFSDRCVY